MPGSAQLGYPPANQDDWYIIRGFYRTIKPSATPNPDKGIPSLKAKPGMPQGQSHAAHDIASLSIIIILLTLITAARLALRLVRRDLRWGPDDYAIIVGLAAVVTWFSLAIAKVQIGGAGRHLSDITYAELDHFIEISTAQTMMFFVAAGLVKVSICLFNRRLTGLTSRRWMICHNIFLGLICSFILASVFIQVFKCRPPLKQWGMIGFGKPANPPDSCLNVSVYALPFNILHIIFDFALLSVPIIVLFKLKMTISKRIRLIFLFSVGSVSCIGAIMRQISTHSKSVDMTWDSSHNQIWTYIDLFFGTLAASLPVLNSMIPKRWRSGMPSIQKPEKMARRMQHPEASSDSDSSIKDGIELHVRAEAIFDESTDDSTRGHSSYEFSNADGTVRTHNPAQSLPRDGFV